MPSPVFTHLIGTLTLISIMFLTVMFVTAFAWYAYVSIQQVRLSEVAESVAREIVEIVSVHSLGEGGFTYTRLSVPQTLGGSAYYIRLYNSIENKIVVEVVLEPYRVVRVVVVPNFGTGNVKVIDGTYTRDGIIYGPELHLPCSHPLIVVERRNGDYYLALGRKG